MCVLISLHALMTEFWECADCARYCPTSDHFLLLLTLLSGQIRPGKDPCSVKPPGLVILYDIAGLLMETIERDENVPAEETPTKKEESAKEEWRFKSGYIPSSQVDTAKSSSAILADYINLIAAARAAVQHMESQAPT